jgi:outer membrane lipoprotein SlyB
MKTVSLLALLAVLAFSGCADREHSTTSTYGSQTTTTSSGYSK